MPQLFPMHVLSRHRSVTPSVTGPSGNAKVQRLSLVCTFRFSSWVKLRETW